MTSDLDGHEGVGQVERGSRRQKVADGLFVWGVILLMQAVFFFSIGLPVLRLVLSVVLVCVVWGLIAVLLKLLDRRGKRCVEAVVVSVGENGGVRDGFPPARE